MNQCAKALKKGRDTLREWKAQLEEDPSRTQAEKKRPAAETSRTGMNDDDYQAMKEFIDARYG